MLLYIWVFVLCILIWILYVLIIWQLLSLFSSTKIPSPFQINNDFWIEWKKFGVVYLFSDITRFAIEWLILWVGNAVVMRLVAIMITFSTSWFFGRWRALVIKKIKKDTKKHLVFWEYLWDTFAGLIFWVPMYAMQLLILVQYDLTEWIRFDYSIMVSVISIILFGRLWCFLADMFEKYVLRKII